MLVRYENENWWKRFIAEAAATAIDKGDMDDYIEYLVPGYYELNDDQKNEAMEAMYNEVNTHFKAFFGHSVEEYI